jgi:hypothetical protein
MNRAHRPVKSKREIYQLGAAKANGFIDMDTLSDARSEQVQVRLFFIRRHSFLSVCDSLEGLGTRLDIILMQEYTSPKGSP